MHWSDAGGCLQRRPGLQCPESVWGASCSVLGGARALRARLLLHARATLSLIENCVTVEVVRCVGSLEQGSPAFLHLSMKPDQNS